MIDFGVPYIVYPVTTVLRTPTKVHLFLVGKIILVEPTKLVKGVFSNEHTGTCGPENSAVLVILSVVFL